ncbi:MAG: hypothetical protein F6K30_13600 [Cyanothece sp. SIO2G6]|nr:hypothetical protein [Cyanothece sp. SIO2G6]
MNLFTKSANALAVILMSTGLTVGFAAQARADYESFVLQSGFTPDPQTGSGLSGGPRYTEDCGFIDSVDAPDHVIQLNESFDFLRAQASSNSDITLVIVGPDGRYCSDDANGLMPEISGYWPAGTYEVWIGDWDGGGYRYEFSLSEF